MVTFYRNLDKLTMMVMIYNDGDLNECERHGDEAETKVRDGEIGDEHIPDFWCRWLIGDDIQWRWWIGGDDGELAVMMAYILKAKKFAEPLFQ